MSGTAARLPSTTDANRRMTPQHSNGFSKILAGLLLARKTTTTSGKRTAQPQPHNPFTRPVDSPPAADSAQTDETAGSEKPFGWRAKPTDARPPEDQLENLSGGELLDKYLTQKGMHHFEGNTQNLERVVEVLGYRDVDEFLGDNPGAQEAIVDFIREWADRNDEWKASLLEHCSDDDEPED